MTGFRVEVAIDAPQEVVWSALTVPAEIRQWFGWEHDGLDDEIRHIFIDHADAGPVEEWHDSRHQRIVVDREGRLVAVAAEEPLVSGIPSPASVTISSYGLDDDELAELRRTWLDRWRSAVPDAAVAP